MKRLFGVPATTASGLFPFLFASCLWASLLETGVSDSACDLQFAEKCYQMYTAEISTDKSQFDLKKPDLLNAAINAYAKKFLPETPCYAYLRTNCTNQVYPEFFTLSEAVYNTYYKVASNRKDFKDGIVAWVLGCFDEKAFDDCMVTGPTIGLPESDEQGRNLTEFACRELKTRLEGCLKSSLRECPPAGNAGKQVLQGMIPTYLKTLGCDGGNSAATITLSTSVVMLFFALLFVGPAVIGGIYI